MSSAATASPKSAEKTQMAAADTMKDPFFSESSQSAWTDSFGSSNDDPFGGSGSETVAKADEPWSAFSDETAQVLMI